MKTISEVLVDIYNIEWEKEELEDCDWWCDACNASLDAQSGFNPYCGTWICTACGHSNPIDKEHILVTLPASLKDIPMYDVKSERDLREQISMYLSSTFHACVLDFDFNADLSALYENESEDDDAIDCEEPYF